MPPPSAPPPPEAPLRGVHLNRITFLSRETAPSDPAPVTPARGTHALRHFLTGPLKEAALLLTGPYRVEDRLRRGATESMGRVWRMQQRRRRPPVKPTASGRSGAGRGGELRRLRIRECFFLFLRVDDRWDQSSLSIFLLKAPFIFQATEFVR